MCEHENCGHKRAEFKPPGHLKLKFINPGRSELPRLMADAVLRHIGFFSRDLDDGPKGLIEHGPPRAGSRYRKSLVDQETQERWKRAERAMDQAFALAHRESEDPERQVGCIILGPDGRVLSAGVNRRRIGAEDAATRDQQFVHAEVIALGALEGDLPEGSMLVVTHAPCEVCTEVLAGVSSPYLGRLKWIVFPDQVAENYALRPDKVALMSEMSTLLDQAQVDEMRFDIHALPDLDPEIQANCARWFNKGLERAIYQPAQAMT